MKRWMKGVTGLLVVGVVGFWWLFLQRSMPTTCAFTIDIEALRAAGNTVAGPKATRIDVDHVTTVTFPDAAVVTGLHGLCVAAGRLPARVPGPDRGHRHDHERGAGQGSALRL